MRGEITDAGQTTDEQVNIELLSQWKLAAEFRNTNINKNECKKIKSDDKDAKQEGH